MVYHRELELEISLFDPEASRFQPCPFASEQPVVGTGSVSRVHQIAATAVSACVYLSKLCCCHPASQAAIAQPPPRPYQDNEVHLGPLYELTPKTFSAARRGPCANDGQWECDIGWKSRTGGSSGGKTLCILRPSSLRAMLPKS